jgi:hypothetical protein
LDGYESCEGNTIEEIAMETFLRDCREKETAMKAIDRESTTMQKAIAKQHVLFGSKGSTRVTFAQGHVSVPSREGSPASDSSGRATPKLFRQKNDNRPSLNKVICQLTSTVEKLTTAVQQPMDSQQNPQKLCS